ncbi:MAG: YbhB/YbcL family Raf kinase inhibitor-like protein [Desulfovibrionaceae bacterium]|nr:YbhB/YbcL family Raf kinase inhibitor-like protein [Desulfovibrionaceae bacterium]
MKLVSNSFADGQKIPAEFAFGVPDAGQHVALGQNRNPHLVWSEAPAGARSFALVCVDHDVPSKGDDANREGRIIAASLPRIDFFHWVLIDLPAHITSIDAGTLSDRIVPRGKHGPAAAHGARQGVNGYTQWFASDEAMRGDYFGYDGPCPPWNDALPHRYVFTVYALDVERLPLEGRFDGPQALEAMKGRVLAQASLTGRYSLNPGVAV